MARQSTGADSKQDYGTPRNLLRAVEKKFGPVVFDLAAHAENAKHSLFFSEEVDSLKQSWSAIPGVTPGNLLWLNPPFKNIAPWARKCSTEAQAGARIAMLTPASVGADWFAEHVWGPRPTRPLADVFFLKGRLTFEGAEDPYPKDCMVSVFSRLPAGEIRIWDWRKDSA